MRKLVVFMIAAVALGAIAAPADAAKKPKKKPKPVAAFTSEQLAPLMLSIDDMEVG